MRDTAGAERSGAGTKYVLLVLVIALMVVGAALLTISSPTRSTTSSSSSQASKPGGQGYLDVPALYSNLGYPKIMYADYSPYLPSKPNFTMQYQTKTVSFQVGSVGGDAMSLDRAVGVAAERAGLDPSNYSLAYASFSPGTIVNSTLVHPEWYLFFARAYDGFWLFGNVGNGAFSVQVTVDALNGTTIVGSPGADLSSLPTSGHYELRVDSSRALEAVRGSSLSGVPPALTENGNVTMMEPRIVLLGPSSNNAAFQNPLNASLSDEKRLCWVIQLYSPTPGYGYQGTFAVDAETGKLVSGWAQNLYPGMRIQSITGSVDYSSAANLTVAQETFPLYGGIVGTLASVPVSVPNVLVVSPGSSASIGLNFSSTMTADLNATLSFANPLPGVQSLSQGGVPQGVSLQFERQALVVPGGSWTGTRLLVSVDKSAPAGTYLLEVSETIHNPQGTSMVAASVLFFLTVWNGTGEWPPPPIVK